MTQGSNPIPSSSGASRWGSGLALALIAGVVAVSPAPAEAAGSGAAAARPLAVVLRDHVARAAPNAHSRRIEAVQARTPITGSRTILPVLGQASSPGKGSWLRVRLPGRPNGHAGWIATGRTKLTTTPWRLVVKLSTRRVLVYRGGSIARRFRAVVGSPSTPTPKGSFFIEESLALSSSDPGGPYALATSARSNVFQEFEGGPGQIGIHGTHNLSGTPGTAVSHGCIRLRTKAITWLARRIGAGVPLTIER